MSPIKRCLNKPFAVALLVTIIAAVLFGLSYFQDNAEAYLFPRIVAFTMLLLSVLSALKAWLSQQQELIASLNLRRLLPALVAILLAVSLLETVGMYTTSAILLFALSMWYSSAESVNARLISSALLTVFFMAFMYLLFSVLLNVQTPRGWFI